MTYEEAVKWLETPDKRYPKADQASFAGLMAELGDPQDKLRFIHVTGSNGKGSICAMLAKILTASGYRTGLYTSPHLSVYNERCCTDGAMIPDDDLARLAERVKKAAEEMQISLGLFYKMTAMAFLYFYEQHCDPVVLEVGRGGRRDCTNIIKNTELCVIGAVSLEHTEVLGSTLSEIAEEKSGIFKPGAAAVLLHQSAEVEETVKRKADEIGIPLVITDPGKAAVISHDLYGQTISYRSRSRVSLSCPGDYQIRNAMAVLDAVDLLKLRGFVIPEAAVEKALSEIRWPGRFEVLQEEPLLIIDGAHNAGAVPALCEGLRTALPGRRYIFVLTLLWDRPWQEMLKETLPLAERYVAVETDDHKALHAEELAAFIRERLGAEAVTAPSEEEAVRTALAAAGKEGGICVFGSMYLAGAVRDIMIRRQSIEAPAEADR